ncbi:MAG: class I SAM-dependent methyltransferase [Magnetococcus sp. YQC-9]
MDLAITTPAEGFIPLAQQLAERLQLAYVPWHETEDRLVLSVTDERLELVSRSRGHGEPVYVEFSQLLAKARRQEGAKQTLARATGLKPGWRPSILDVTPGLGRDGFVLAALGCRVTFVERSPILHTLIGDGLARARHNRLPEAERIMLFLEDGVAHLTRLIEGHRPDVVYLDPMHPERLKSALVKKEMRLLRAVVGDDPDADLLLAPALSVARQRVVVKRPRLSPPLANRKADAVVEGRSVRYDLYFSAADSGSVPLHVSPIHS